MNRVSGVLIGSSNIRRTRVPNDWILEHVHLTSSFDSDFSGEQGSVHS